ncbi:DUF4435 domain-containing protein [Halodesulfovibrio aestuarii]|uniref:DUF4435 domain-containing protein n=1 Tax=Halodesulfovibrio aestuarii TaxID=126333 RepID=UPI003D32DAD5
MGEDHLSQDIPSWSLDAALTLPVLYGDLNDLDVFIEDEEKVTQQLYVELLRSLFPDKKIEKVFPLKGRKNVIDGAKNISQQIVRPTLFIVDGDMYNWGVPSPEVPDIVFVLPCYCIENVLCTHVGALKICWEESRGKSRREIAEEFAYDFWLQKNERLLTALFLEYSVVISLAYPGRTVKNSIGSFCGDASGIVVYSRLIDKIREIRQECITLVGRDKYFSEKRRISDYYRKNISRVSHLLSGKHVWLPLLMTRIAAVGKPRISKESMRLRLLDSADLGFFDGIENYVLLPNN